MSDGTVNGSEIDPGDWMRGQMILALRDVERRFHGAAVTLIVSAPGAAKGSPQFSHATSADAADLDAVLGALIAERK